MVVEYIYSGTTIAYNSIGCPTTYEGKTATWTMGKLTKLFSGSLITGTNSYNYAYNALGQRVSRSYSCAPGKSSAWQPGQLKTSNCLYYYDHVGRLIAQETLRTYHQLGDNSDKIVFLYDESSIIGMVRTVNGAANTYYFQRNLLGDVVAIFDTNGAMVAKYLYDAWGNCTISGETTNTAVAAANPIRYRGYYYDDDTGLYYCNARYYSPKWRRFISPDDTAYLSPEDVNGLNLYCYCNNDPVNYTDPSGHMPEWAKWLIGGLVIAGLAIATIATGGAAGGVAGFILAGALKGAVVGAVSGAVVSGAIGGISSAIAGDGFWIGFATGAANGFMSGAIVGGITGAISSGVQVYNASKLWANTGNKTAYRQMVDHYQNHVIREGQKSVAKNIVKYSKDAHRFFVNNSSSAEVINAQLGVVKIAGAPGGIFDPNGLIRSFWYIPKL